MSFVKSAALSLALVACAQEPDDDAGLLARHTEAVGGREALEAVRSMRAEMEVVEPAFTVTGDYRATRNDRMRIDIYMNGARVFTEALDGETGWQTGGDGAIIDLSEAGEGALRRGVADNLYGLHEFAALGHTVSEGPDATIDGETYHTLDVVYADGFETRYYLDTETLLIERERSEFALHPDINPEQQLFEEIFSDYREVDGVMRPFFTQRRDLRTGEIAQTTTVLSFETNPELDPAQFERPSE